MTDQAQRRITYMSKIINEELSEAILLVAAVLDAVLSSVEVGLRDPAQNEIFGVNRIASFSYGGIYKLLYAKQGSRETVLRTNLFGMVAFVVFRGALAKTFFWAKSNCRLAKRVHLFFCWLPAPKQRPKIIGRASPREPVLPLTHTS